MDQNLPIETSPFEKNRGRLKNKGIREENEHISKHYGTKLSKKGIHFTYSVYKQQGHNKASYLKVC